jgi:hypothetical protein
MVLQVLAFKFNSLIGSDCVMCQRCGTRDPGRGGWTQSYTLCSPCSAIYKEKVAPHRQLLISKLNKLKRKRLENAEAEEQNRTKKKAKLGPSFSVKHVGPFGPSLLPVPWEKVKFFLGVLLIQESGSAKSWCLPTH